MEEGSTSLSASTSHGDGNGNCIVQPKHKVFLSHSGAQKGFVEQLCVDLERWDCHPFFDKRRDCLPIGKEFPRLIFEAIEQCEVGVVVLSEEFFTSKWPMLELVAMANVKKRKPNFRIMPILLCMTLSQCRDPDNHKRWLPLWQTWAAKDSTIDVEEWESALQLFGPTNALKYNLELGEVRFREEIVVAVCDLVSPGTRFEDSHIQGRSRLCKVINEFIKESKVSPLYGVCIVGVYGVGGIGKTTICKAMCNDLSEEFRNKVSYVQLGIQSEEGLLKEVLEKLSDKSLQRLGAMDVDKYRHHLMRDMMSAKVLLAIDNVSSRTTSQALTLLRANYGLWSVVLVTARSLNELMALRVDASACMEMPKLEMEEAKSLFLYHASCVPSTHLSNKDDCELISFCVERCYFLKGDGLGCHYHPLALQVLGSQLGCIGYVPERWRFHLNKPDFLNPFGEVRHPMFSILRISFDLLEFQDQLLFMDVALFAPGVGDRWLFPFKFNIFEWLGMVHGRVVEDVMERLENLKRKSVLENLGDGFNRIGMHDLWREFAKFESKVGEFEKRWWMYEYGACEEGNLTNGDCFVNMRRMFFLDEGLKKVKGVKFSCFPNVAVLKLEANLPLEVGLDLRGLKHLRSLELDLGLINSISWTSVDGLGSLLKLVFLRLHDIPSNSPSIDEISGLTNLKMLNLKQCGRFPDLGKLISLQVAYLRENDLVVNLIGLSSKHSSLQFLDLSNCKALESCLGVGELVALQELCLFDCGNLKEVPNLRKLKCLRKSDVSCCSSLIGLPGLGDLVSLLEVKAPCCHNLVELSDICNLQNLKILDLDYCMRIESLQGVEELVGLQSLEMLDCNNLTQVPNVYKLTNLQSLSMDFSCSPQTPTRWSDLISLSNLDVDIDEVHDGPNLCKLTNLQRLVISRWSNGGFSSLAKLVLLESLELKHCKGMCVMPNLKRLSRLCKLELWSCDFGDLSGLINLTNLETLVIIRCDKLDAFPDLQELGNLELLIIIGCKQLRDVRGILGLWNMRFLEMRGHPWLHENLGSDLQRLVGLHDLDISYGGFEDMQWLSACLQLRTLDCRGCPMQEFPDLINFRKLEGLDVRNCVNLIELTCTGCLSSTFESLNVSGCMRLQTLPDLSNVQEMQTLDVSTSGVVLSAEVIQDMKTRWPSIHLITQDTSSRPSIDLITKDSSS